MSFNGEPVIFFCVSLGVSRCRRHGGLPSVLVMTMTKGGLGFKEGGGWRIRLPVSKTLLVLASSEFVAFSVALDDENTENYLTFGVVW